jgi:hypothetical protein
VKPYNIKHFETGVNVWVDLDHILEIFEPVAMRICYQYMFKDKHSTIEFIQRLTNDARADIKSRERINAEIYNDVYIPFLEAWKNKDVINVSK